MLIAAAHEWGFYTKVGLDIFGILSVGDYISIALQAFPWAILIICFISMLENDFKILAILATSSYKTITKIALLLFLVLIFFMAIPFVKQDDVYYIAFLYGIPLYLWFLWFFNFLSNNYVRTVSPEMEQKLVLIEENYYNIHPFLIFIIPPLLILSAGIGTTRGHFNLLVDKGQHHLTLKDKNKTIHKNIQFLRALSTGIIVRYPKEEKIVFITWNSVESIEEKSPKLKPLSFMCKNFDISCDQEEKELKEKLKSSSDNDS